MFKKVAIFSLLLTLPLLPSCQKDKAPKNENQAAAVPAIAPAASGAAQAADASTDKKAEDPNMKVAIINDRVFTAGELDKEFAPISGRLVKMGAPAEKIKEMRIMFLGKLIERELLFQEAKKHNFVASEEQVNKELQELKGRFPSEEEFLNFLKESSFDLETLKKQISEGNIIDQLVKEEVEAKVAIDDAAIKAFYDAHTDQFMRPEQLKASHILVKVDNAADEAKKTEAKKKAEDILKKVKAGGDFAALAKEFSNCPSAAQGGDLGYFGKGQMVKPFEDACLALKVGEISGLVETQFGYHIIKLTDHKDAGMVPLDEVKEGLGKQLKEREVQTKMREYIETLRKNAKVERMI